jgi:hypothetical protein
VKSTDALEERASTMKRKHQSFSLNAFIERHGVQKKKKKKNVNVHWCTFTPELPPSNKLTNCLEIRLYQMASQIVLNHLMMALGLFNNEGNRIPTTMDMDTKENQDDASLAYASDESFDYASDYARTFVAAFNNDESSEWSFVLEDLFMPMACAFVHQTKFVSRIKRFQQEIGHFSVFLKQKFREDDFSQIVWDWVFQEDLCDFEPDEVDAFEESGWGNNVGFLFHLVLESHVVKLLRVIQELEVLFKSPYAASNPKSMIRKKVWEVLVRDWVQQSVTEEEYIRLYDFETKGGLWFYEDFVVPERQGWPIVDDRSYHHG